VILYLAKTCEGKIEMLDYDLTRNSASVTQSVMSCWACEIQTAFSRHTLT